MVVELRMQYCDEIIKDSFETYKTFPGCLVTEFEWKVGVKNHEFGWVCFQNRFLTIK